MTRSLIDGRNVWVHNVFIHKGPGVTYNIYIVYIIYIYIYKLYISSHFHGRPYMHMEGLVQLVVRLLLQRAWIPYETTDTLIN